MKITNNILTGRKGEAIAAQYLEQKGFKIIEKNWHYSKNAEIDIIAEYKGELIFVEVKTRRTLNYGHPFESITTSKTAKIHKAMLGYIAQSAKKYKSYRFDGIAIIGLNNPVIEHLENIGQF